MAQRIPVRHARPAPAPLLLAGLLALGGCTNLSGLGGSSEFHCKAPEGVPCLSISGVSANERAGTLPGRPGAASATPGATTGASGTSGPAMHPAAYVPGRGPVAAEPAPALGAIRSEPTQIRIWIAPWEDADGDLNDAHLVYLQIDAGRWLIEHNRERIRRDFAPRAAMPAPASPVAPGASAPARAAPSAQVPAAAPLPAVAPAALASRPAAPGGTP